MNTTRRILVHVGCPKTGTTYLQSALWQSRPALVAQGFELPLDRVSHFHLALAVRDQLDPALDPPRALSVLDRFATALAESAATTVVVSNEILAGATAEQASGLWRLIEEAMPDAEPHLVVTVRDLARQVPAEWQQQIQQRRTITWPDYLQSLRDGSEPAAYFRPAQDASDIARRWSDRLPPERVHVVTVPPPGAPQRILLERFCRALGIDFATLSDAAPVVNESLGRVPIELLRRVNAALGDRLPHPRAGFGRVGKRYFAQQVLAPMGGERPILPADMVRWCHDNTERIVADLRTAGYDIIGDLDDLRPDARMAASPSPDVSDAELVTVAVEALATLLAQRQRDLERIDDLRERTRTQRKRPDRGQRPGAGVPTVEPPESNAAGR